MATAKIINVISQHISTSGPGIEEAEALKSALNAAKSSCISNTEFLNNALSQYKQISNLLNSSTCKLHLGTIDFASRVALGDFLDDSLKEEFGTNPSQAVAKVNSLIYSACSLVNGLIHFVNMMKNFMLNIYSLTDFLRSLSDFGFECKFGNLVLLTNQTDSFSSAMSSNLPSYMIPHLNKSERLMGKLYGNSSTGVKSIVSLQPVEFAKESSDTISMADILRLSKVHPGSPMYDADYEYMYNSGVRLTQDIIDMQSRLINSLVSEAGEIGTSELMTQGSCSISGYDNKSDCENAGGVWSVNSDIIKTTPNTPKTWYIKNKSELLNSSIQPGDFVELNSNGLTYSRSTELLPTSQSDLQIQGETGADAPYHYTLVTKSKIANPEYITLNDIADLNTKLVTITTDYDNLIYKKTLSITKYNNLVGKMAEIGTDPAIIQNYMDFVSSYDLKTDNITKKYKILNNNPNKIGQLKWIIEAGLAAIASNSNTVTKNDGITGDITLTFPLKTYDYDNISNNDSTNSNEYISTDVNKPNSFNNHIKQFYDEIKHFDEFILNLTESSRSMEQLYNDFVLKNSLTEKLFYGITKNYNYPGKNSVRLGDAKIYVAFDKPHNEILNEVPNNATMNFFHGDIFYNSSNDVVYMYLRLLGNTPGYYTYEWKPIRTNIQWENDSNNVPVNTYIDIPPSIFLNIENKANTYTSVVAPSTSWNEFKSWMNVGDIWIDTSDISKGTIQKVYAHNGTDFVWILLLNNNAPLLAPVVINTAENSAISGNILNETFDLEGDSFYLYSVVINGTEILTDASVSSVDVNITNLGTLKLIGNKGDYYFTPLVNVSTSISFSYVVKDSKGATSTALWTIYITPMNNPPVIVGPISKTFSADMTTKMSINLLENTTDPDNNELSVNDLSCISGNDQAFDSYQKFFETLFITPSYYKNILKRNESEVINFTYSVTDGYSPKSLTGATITINGVNHPPVINGDITKTLVTTSSNLIISLLEKAFDFDGDTMNALSTDVSYTGNSAGISLNSSLSKLTVNSSFYHNILKRGKNEIINVSYRLTDSMNEKSNVGTAIITITGGNHPPVVTSNISVTLNTNDPVKVINLLQNATDFDNDLLSVDPTEFAVAGNLTGISYSSPNVTITPSAYSSLLTNVNDYADIVYTYYVLDEMSARSNQATAAIRIIKA